MRVKNQTFKIPKISVDNPPRENNPQKWLMNFFNIKSNFLFQKISNHIQGEKVLDIGTGSGFFAAYLYLNGYQIETVDVQNKSFFEEFPNKIYDGFHLPYQDDQFDTALLIYVLHHCEDRIQVLKEALRVSKRVIFIEDTYRNKLEWLWVAAKDMIGNGEFFLHEYSTTEEWSEILNKEQCNILYEDSYSRMEFYLFYGRYALFVVEKNEN